MLKKFFVILPALALIGAGCSNQPATPNTPAVNQTVTTSQNTGAQTTYTLDDVAKHATASDCWMAISGKVYDVTSYVDQHPGGPKITRGCGADATAMFQGVDQHGGGKAQSELANLFIGNLK